MLQVAKALIVDNDAVEIGRLYAHGQRARAESLRAYWECGHRLIKFYGPEADDHSIPVGQSIIYPGRAARLLL